MTLIVIDSQVVSTNASGVEGNGGNYAPVFSPDGTKVAFFSTSTNLVPNDTNGTVDLFIKDLTTGAITRANTSALGGQAMGEVELQQIPVFSPDGTKIMFQSRSSNLVPGDTNGIDDIFIKNLTTGSITRANTTADGNQAIGVLGDLYSPTFSPDGTKIAFTASTSNLNGPGAPIKELLLKDLSTGEISIASTNFAGDPGNGSSYEPYFSPDGTKIVFFSFASNLVAAEDKNDWYDVFVKDLVTGEVTLVNTDSAGNQPSLDSGFGGQFSPDGTKVSFSSVARLVSADNNQKIDIYIKDMNTGIVTLASTDSQGNIVDGHTFECAFSPDGIYMAIATNAVFSPDDQDRNWDLYLKNLVTDEMTLLCQNASEPTFSADGTKLVAVDGETGEIVVLTLASVITGTNHNDILSGTSFNDTIYGLEGDDVLTGQGGLDILAGGTGNDTYIINDQNTAIVEHSNEGIDQVISQVNHFLASEVENLILQGTSSINGAGNELNNAIAGNDSGNSLFGLGGNDTIAGAGGTDSLYGGAGTDTLSGDAGADILYGEDGMDYLTGGIDGDLLNGGAETDLLYGGLGADTFQFDLTALTGGKDTVKDFSLAQGDKIELHNLLFGYDALEDSINNFVRITQSGKNSFLAVDADGSANGHHYVQIAQLLNAKGMTDEDQLLAKGHLLIT